MKETDEWKLRYNDWNPEEQPLREALCTLGNGIIATRGAAEEVTENAYNYPGTYLAGGYNRLTSDIAGKKLENEDLVNWPNWLYLSFRHEDGPWFDLEQLEVIEYMQELDLKQGTLLRKMKFMDRQQRITSLISTRVVSMGDPHEAGIEWILIPENWSGSIIIRSGIDGRVTNHGVERYRALEGKHLEIEDKGQEKKQGDCGEDPVYLSARTIQSEIKLSIASRTIVLNRENERIGAYRQVDKKDFAGEDITVACEKLIPLRVNKLVCMYSSRDFAISDPLTETLSHVRRLEHFSDLKKRNEKAWQGIWEKSDILIGNQHTDENQMILRLHIFHLYQTVSRNSIGYDVGVPSRGWHGEAYRGHIFWDEIYIFPYLILHNPQLARSLLMYRYRRLPKAKEQATSKGYRGSMFPWQSGSNGREESQVMHLNPESGRWIPDNTHLQIHITAAICFNVWQYYQSTNDIEFLLTYGAEIIFHSALFWGSVAKHNPKRDRYEIWGVVGPDEYHTRYPGSESQGLNNNAYTNFMAVWVLLRALEITEMVDDDTLRRLQIRVGFDERDMDHWRDISLKMFIPIQSDGVIMQFEGFEKLEELDWEKYRKAHGETMRLDRILETEHDTVNRYRACKQADVLMIFYLFSSEEIMEVLGRLGYEFRAGQIPDNIAYYKKITSHGSTLSEVVHSWVYSRSDRNKSWDIFSRALKFDIEDVQGGTTSEGIHLGAMAGTVDLVLRGYSGMEIRENVLWFNPRLPGELNSVTFHLRYRSHWIKMHITHKKICIDFDKGWANPVEIGIKGKKYTFQKDDYKEFKL
ncbi:MAG TPA: glycoside hydrolase family 65 protein [Bacteroides sp.]|nr:glycoside hydrolase family 65 protein [Bacteroides sp.]